MNSSSLSPAPFNRLLWKEYRVQRSLWLAMLVLGLVPQLLFKMVISDQNGRVGAVWSMVFVLPFLFVIGSAAILFAGEREERTVDWLHNLAAPPLWTLLAKWSFLLMATAALAIILSVVALALVWTAPIADLPQDREDFAIRTFWMFAGVLLWSVLGSLVSRRVITSVPAMGFWWLMTLVVPLAWLLPLFGAGRSQSAIFKVQETLIWLSFMGIAVANVVLGWRWCQGKYLDASILDRFNSQIKTSINRLRGQTATKPRVPARVETDSHWQREWQRLTWQERHREVYHRSLLYLGCSVGVMLGLLSVVYAAPLMSGVIPIIVTLPLAMGILGFRYDGEGQPLRFLNNRGIESRMVWLAKHAVWLPRAIWIPLVVWLVSGIIEKLMPRYYVTPPGRELLDVGAWIIQTYPVGVLAFIVLTYGCGHLAATLLSRVVLAAVVGVAASLLATLWLLVAITMHVPLWWSVGGLLLWIYAVGYWNAPHWQMERPLIDRPIRLAGFVVPPLLLVAAWGAWRAYEIPLTIFLSNNYDMEYVRMVNSINLELANREAAQSETDQEQLDRLALTINGRNTENEFKPQSYNDGTAADALRQPVDPVEAFWRENETRLTELIEITRNKRGPSLSDRLQLFHADPTRIAAVLPQQHLLLEAGRLRTKEGRLDDALAYYCASMRLASYWATDRGLSTCYQAQFQQLYAVQSIFEWANHPQQTGKSLLAARDRIQTEFDLFPTIQQTLIAEHHADLMSLEESLKHGIRNASSPDPSYRAYLFDYFRYLPWEQARVRRWLEHRLVVRRSLATFLIAALQRPGFDVSHSLAQWRTSDYEMDVQFPTPLAPSGSQYVGQELPPLIIERAVIVRESLLALSLLAWRLDHDQWPDSLGDLLANENDPRALPASTTIDPWSGELFHYNGRLLNHLKDHQESAEMLSTVGPSHLREVFVDSPREASEMVTHQGARALYDDRLLLKIRKGKLVFQLMNSDRFPQPTAEGSNSGGQ